MSLHRHPNTAELKLLPRVVLTFSRPQYSVTSPAPVAPGTLAGSRTQEIKVPGYLTGIMSENGVSFRNVTYFRKLPVSTDLFRCLAQIPEYNEGTLSFSGYFFTKTELLYAIQTGALTLQSSSNLPSPGTTAATYLPCPVEIQITKPVQEYFSGDSSAIAIKFRRCYPLGAALSMEHSPEGLVLIVGRMSFSFGYAVKPGDPHWTNDQLVQ